MKIKYVGTEEWLLGFEGEATMEKFKLTVPRLFNDGPFIITDLSEWELDLSDPELFYRIEFTGRTHIEHIPGNELLERLCLIAINKDTYQTWFLHPEFTDCFFYFYPSKMTFGSMMDLQMFPSSKTLADWWNQHVGN